MPLPGLHVVTDDAVLIDDRFPERAAALIDAHGPALALHLRGHRTPAARLLSVAEALAPRSSDAGGLLLLNDRADVALAAGAGGVLLGRRSLPVAAVRALAPDWVIGASVHGVEEASGAGDADFFLLGTIWETESHPGREGSGTAMVREVRDRFGIPVVAIGGVTPERAGSALRAGAHGIASLRGIWQTDDPVGAAAEYVHAMAEGAAEQE